MRHGVVIVLITLLSAGHARAEESVESRLRALAAPKHAAHSEAKEWWNALSQESRVLHLRAALGSDDTELATIAARAVDPRCLDLGEIRRMCTLLAKRPLSLVNDNFRAWWGNGPNEPAGSIDMLPFWRGLVSTSDFEEPQPGNVNRVHKLLRTRHMNALLPLLEEGNPLIFSRLAWNFGQCALYDREDRHRDVAVKGMLYALERLRAEREGKPRPKLEALRVELRTPEGGGLPDAFVRIAPSFLEDEIRGYPPAHELPPLYFQLPHRWLIRWALTLVAAEKDLSYLNALVEANTGEYGFVVAPALVLWALRQMARLPGPNGREQVASWAAGKNEIATYAATALAMLGNPTRFRAMHDAGVDVEPLTWIVDRALARNESVTRILGAVPARSDQELSPQARLILERQWDIRILEDDLDWIEDELWTRGARTLTLFWWHAHVRQGRISDARVERLIERLRSIGALDWDKDVDLEGLIPFFATLELRRPRAFRDLLRTWLTTQPGARSGVLRLLARLGDTQHVDAMIADWPRWCEWADDGWMLGFVKDERVRAFLEARASSEHDAQAAQALAALAIQSGLPAATRPVFWGGYVHEIEPPERLARARELLLDGRPIDALIQASRNDSEFVYLLGLVDDVRVRTRLRELRAARHNALYWEATIGLALAGDADARSELTAFLDEDRTWLLMDLEDDVLAEFERTFIDRWLDRLDSNCCLGHEWMLMLQGVYPTLPFDDGFGGAGRRRTREWIDAGTWRRSPLVEGWVPLGK